jgi:hypothetical protein
MQVGGAAPGHRTLIDALAPALDALPQGVAAAAKAAREGANATAQMTRAKAGRASYLAADKLKGHNDPGAEGVARLFEDLARPPGRPGQPKAPPSPLRGGGPGWGAPQAQQRPLTNP